MCPGSLADDDSLWSSQPRPHNKLIPLEYRMHKIDARGIAPVHVREKCGMLTPREVEITSHSAVTLLERIHNEDYTAVEVTIAFCKAAAVAHQIVCKLQ